MENNIFEEPIVEFAGKGRKLTYPWNELTRKWKQVTIQLEQDSLKFRRRLDSLCRAYAKRHGFEVSCLYDPSRMMMVFTRISDDENR